MWKIVRTDPPPELSPLVENMIFKQSLDPARFDHYHPRLARALAKIEAQLISPATTTPTTSVAPTEPQQISPEPVPEPATLLLTIGMASYALWRRRRSS